MKDIKFAPDAEIHLDSEVINKAWTQGNVWDAAYAAYQQGAKIIVHDINDYNNTYEVPAYAE